MLAKLAGTLLRPTAAERDADGQDGARAHPGAGNRGLAEAVVEPVEARLVDQAGGIRFVHLGVAGLVAGVEREVAGIGGQAGAAIDGVDLGDVGIVAGQQAGRGAADVLAGARGEPADLEADARTERGRAAHQPGDDVLVAGVAVIGEAALVAGAGLRLAVARRHRGVDAGRDAGIGHRIAAAQVRVECLARLHIGLDDDAAAAVLRQGRRRRDQGECGSARSVAKVHDRSS